MADRSIRTDSRREIVLKMRGSRPNRVVLQSAVRIASTFRGRLRGYFSDDDALITLASLPFAQELSATSGRSRKLTLDGVRAEMAAAREAIRREFELLAPGGEFEAILESAAPQEVTGILAYGEPLDRFAARFERSALNEIATEPVASGILVAGSRAVRSSGPVVALLEPNCDVAAIIDTSERIARFDGQTVAVVIVGHSTEQAEKLSRDADRALDPDTRTSRHKTRFAEPRSLAYLAKSLKAGLVIAWARGALGGDGLERFACQLECPLLLMR